MIEVHDQMDRLVSMQKPAQRIISLVPSITELLSDLGLEKEVVGITKFCVHPREWFKRKTRIGGTKQVDVKKVLQLKPDLVIANKEENVEAQVNVIAQNVPVYISDVNTLDDASAMIKHIGLLTNTATKAFDWINKITDAFDTIHHLPIPVKTCYLIWNEPLMTVGNDTFIHHLMERMGLENIFRNEIRYPQTTPEDILSLDCELLLLSSEPFPFKEKHQELFKNSFAEKISEGKSIPEIKMVDGEMFSWYGSRLVLAAEYLKELQASLILLKTHL